MSTRHDRTAGRLARKEKARYNRGKGPDIVTRKRAIEVESAATVGDAMRQLRGFRKPVYIAGADAKATVAALRRTRGTTVGVMNAMGRIVKSSTRKRRRR